MRSFLKAAVFIFIFGQSGLLWAEADDLQSKWYIPKFRSVNLWGATDIRFNPKTKLARVLTEVNTSLYFYQNGSRYAPVQHQFGNLDLALQYNWLNVGNGTPFLALVRPYAGRTIFNFSQSTLGLNYLGYEFNIDQLVYGSHRQAHGVYLGGADFGIEPVAVKDKLSIPIKLSASFGLGAMNGRDGSALHAFGRGEFSVGLKLFKKFMISAVSGVKTGLIAGQLRGGQSLGSQSQGLSEEVNVDVERSSTIRIGCGCCKPCVEGDDGKKYEVLDYYVRWYNGARLAFTFKIRQLGDKGSSSADSAGLPVTVTLSAYHVTLRPLLASYASTLSNNMNDPSRLRDYFQMKLGIGFKFH